MTEPDSQKPDTIPRAGAGGGSASWKIAQNRALLALCLMTVLSGCQSSATHVYVDPAANLGRASSEQAATSARQAGYAVDAQGQPNDEFDGRSWVDNRRGDERIPARATRQPRETVQPRDEQIPLLRPPPSDGVELSPSMFGRTGR